MSPCWAHLQTTPNQTAWPPVCGHGAKSPAPVSAAELSASVLQYPGCWRTLWAANTQALSSPLARHALAQLLTLPLQVSCPDAGTGSSTPVG